ncbi:MAG: hypothetical protein R3D98_03345 [Candidatus Krumholzibacteriia bacterium]
MKETDRQESLTVRDIAEVIAANLVLADGLPATREPAPAGESAPAVAPAPDPADPQT